LLRTRLLHFVKKSAPTDDVRDVLGLWLYPDHEVQRLQRDMEAINAYRFSRYDGPIHVFRARTHALRRRQPPKDMGWGCIAGGPLTVETVPGSHDSIFRAPFARTLARRLDAVLQRTFRDGANGFGEAAWPRPDLAGDTT
jgi:hypothetical protein